MSCHGGDKKIKGGLRLTSREAILKGGDSGPAVDLDKPEQSLLLQAVNYREPKMPPKGKLPQAQIDILTRWVQMGIPWSAWRETPSRNATARPRSMNRRNSSGRSVRSSDPHVPAVRRRKLGHKPDRPLRAGEAGGGRVYSRLRRPTRAALLRRIYYDLIGLPPSPAEVDAFLADHSPDAYEKVVDRLLASPHYGEHWARHWLDLVRYAETNSFERDGAKPIRLALPRLRHPVASTRTSRTTSSSASSWPATSWTR